MTRVWQRALSHLGLRIASGKGFGESDICVEGGGSSEYFPDQKEKTEMAVAFRRRQKKPYMQKQGGSLNLMIDLSLVKRFFLMTGRHKTR